MAPEAPAGGIKHIVAGVDGSPGAMRAVEWAAAEAGRAGARLTLVGAGSREGKDEARRVVEDASVRVGELRPGVAVDRSVEVGRPAVVLIRAAQEADLLVIGARGRGGFHGMHVGSVGQHCLSNAPCSVAVVRWPGDGGPVADGGPRRIAVGVDGSKPSELALDWAVAEAIRSGASLEVLSAWIFPGTAGYVFTVDVAVPEAARRALDRALERVAAVAPDLEVHGEVPEDPPAVALQGASRRVDLLVVGSRGLGAFQGLLLGAVSHHVAQHAHCPVVVVRPPRDA